MKKLLLFLLLILSFKVYSQELLFFVSPGVAVPFGPTMTGVEGSPYTPGFKIDGRVLFPLGESPLNIHGQLGVNIAPFSGSHSSGESFTLLSIQGGPNYTLNLTPAFNLGVTAMAGAYMGILEGGMGANGLVSARADMNLLLNTNLSLGLGLDYSYFLTNRTENIDHAWSGMGISLNLSYIMGASEVKSRLEIEDIIIFPIYPVLHSYYNKNKIGEITIRNTESRAIENVGVTLYIPQYMSAPQLFSTEGILEKGEVKTLPIYGLLDSSILNETEGLLVQAKVEVTYDLKGNSYNKEAGKEAEVLYRNALSWVDDQRAASFVTAKEPGVIEFAKNTISTVSDKMNTELDDSLTTAMTLFEALSLYGIKYQIDPNSSYSELAEQGELLDYLQFPVETLNYKAGDCDDMAVLYTALLEALAVETAFITVPGHIYTAAALKMSPSEARKTFTSGQSIIYEDDKAWIPIETTMMDGNSFVNAWTEGSRQWYDAVEKESARLYPIQKAWQTYPPVALNAFRGKELTIPGSGELLENYETQESLLIARETSVQVDYLEKAIRDSQGTRRYRMINSLAVLKARYGLFDEAINLLGDISTSETAYLPGITNLANIYYRLGELDKAATYYNRALSGNDENPKAILGLMLVAREMGNIAQVQSNYKELVRIAPEIAEMYSHLINDQSGINRAGDANQKESVLWDEE
ncbi:MAG: hypothetical protein JEY99_21480 [Spirochaetales bacterium]|nr:hypothetical protein [Spirochaetales bacterium]